MGVLLFLLVYSLATSKRHYYTKAELEQLRRECEARDHGLTSGLPASSTSESLTRRF